MPACPTASAVSPWVSWGWRRALTFQNERYLWSVTKSGLDWEIPWTESERCYSLIQRLCIEYMLHLGLYGDRD